MARSIRGFPLLTVVITALLLAAALGSANAQAVIYDSSTDNFASWQTNHTDKFYWDEAVGAYHYSLADAANDYAFVSVPYPDGSFVLEFDWLPSNTGWAGNFRFGLWDSKMTANAASSVYANYNLDDNGYHVMMEAYWPGGSAAVTPGTYTDGRWYHTSIVYSEGERTVTVTFVYSAEAHAWVTATATEVGPFAGLDRIGLTSIGDNGYPGATAEGYIRNVRLSASPTVAEDTAVFDYPAIASSFYLAPRMPLPIRFHLVDANGNTIAERRDVTLEITEVSSPSVITNYRFSAADRNLTFSTLRSPQYTALFRRATLLTPGGGLCTATVEEGGMDIGGIWFNISSTGRIVTRALPIRSRAAK
ncbi:MAG: hypothetical protein ACE149_04115 [Armatimonadota bacterium]